MRNDLLCSICENNVLIDTIDGPKPACYRGVPEDSRNRLVIADMLNPDWSKSGVPITAQMVLGKPDEEIDGVTIHYMQVCQHFEVDKTQKLLFDILSTK
jgi:hypothetical protein